MYDTRIVKRLKGQRYDKDLIPWPIWQTESGEFWQGIITDEKPFPGVVRPGELFKLPCPYGGPPIDAQYVEIEYSGWLVPAYRLWSPPLHYVICQMRSYKAVRL